MHELESSTSGISLRLIEESDLPYLLELRSDKKICESIVYTALNPESQLAWYRGLKNEYHFCIVNGDGTRVGVVGLFDIHPIHRRAKWNLRISPFHQRKGYAREAVKLFLEFAFSTMNINKLMGDCFEDNIAEINNLNKLGFRREGKWHEHYFHKGRFKASIQFAMLQSEYRIYKKTNHFNNL